MFFRCFMFTWEYKEVKARIKILNSLKNCRILVCLRSLIPFSHDVNQNANPNYESKAKLFGSETQYSSIRMVKHGWSYAKRN